jgi:hypothetical protein
MSLGEATKTRPFSVGTMTVVSWSGGAASTVVARRMGSKSLFIGSKNWVRLAKFSFCFRLFFAEGQRSGNGTLTSVVCDGGQAEFFLGSHKSIWLIGLRVFEIL